MDNHMVKILSVSGGRVIGDFNNPLAGKEVDYNFKINKIITDNKEKVNAIQDFFFRQRFEFDLDEKTKKVIFKKPEIKPLVDMMREKLEKISGLKFEVAEEEEKKDEKNIETFKQKDTNNSQKKENKGAEGKS